MKTVQNSYGTEITDEPCGCRACDKGIEPGHFLCSQPIELMLKHERSGLVIRHLIGGPGNDGPQRWAWFLIA